MNSLPAGDMDDGAHLPLLGALDFFDEASDAIQLMVAPLSYARSNRIPQSPSGSRVGKPQSYYYPPSHSSYLGDTPDGVEKTKSRRSRCCQCIIM